MSHRYLTGAMLVLAVTACVPGAPRATPRRTSAETSVPLHGHPLKLHLSNPTDPTPEAARILLVYTSGDAGWFGKDRAMFNHLVEWGYPAVGFSAREYVHHLGSDALSPEEIAEDYQAIINTACQALQMPQDTRAVLVGKSRGAGLAVAAAGIQMLRSDLAGVVAVGLTREEEYVFHRGAGQKGKTRAMLDTYKYLPRLGDLPLAVIQSAGDSYVPAGEARSLFGPDSATRELIAVAGDDHNFGGALDELYEQMQHSIDWILMR